MYIKRIVSAVLAAVLTGTALTSCSERCIMEMPFVEDNKREYSSVVENSALTIYVDSNANDNGDGSESSPFKSIPEAQTKIRELKSGEGLPSGGITVLVKDGEYKLDSTLNFTEEDSGTEDCPIIYVSENEFGAVLTGGLILSAEDFEPISEEEKARLIDGTAKEKVVKVDLKKYRLTETDWGKIYSYGGYSVGHLYDNGTGPSESELFINGVRQRLSRYPNDGFLKTSDVVDMGDAVEYFSDTNFDGRGEATRNDAFDSMRNPKGGTVKLGDDIIDRVSLWSTLDDVWTFGYFKWSWADASVPVGNIDIENKTFTLGQSSRFSMSKGAPFYFFNVFEELDAVGEFYIDRVNGVLYVYRSEDFDTAEIMMSCMVDNLINASNISYVTIKGFSLCASRANGLIMNGHHFTVDNCEIQNVRNGAINVSGNDITISNCDISRTGSYGIEVTGGDNATLTKSNNLVYNNYIHDWSDIVRVNQPAIYLRGCGNTASHNEICNSPHQALSCKGPYNTYEYNEVYNVCLETGDCGTLHVGRNYISYGTVIRYNYFHDIGNPDSPASGWSASGIYFDDGISGLSAYGNIIVNATGHGFLIGGGRDIEVYNNIIINTGGSPLCYDQRTRDEVLDPVNAWFTHVEEMANELVATKNEIWIEAFPVYGQIIPWSEGYSGDKDEPFLSGNPANSIVKNNLTYYIGFNYNNVENKALKHAIGEDVPRFSEIKDNPIIHFSESDFPGYNNGDITIADDAFGLELCPGFEIIPFEEIGRVE